MTTAADTVVIRALSESDIPALRELIGSVARERRWLATFDAFSLEDTTRFVQAALADNAPNMVAETDEGLVGWCDITPLRALAAYAGVGTLGMGVLAGWRGKGLGQQLVVRTLDAARHLGLRRVELQVRADNAAALALYRRAGFVVEGCKRAAVRVDGLDYDVVGMGLLFGRDD
ncbi:GNAT family N-acetyltransferase [Niveibacterium sp. SC-1]|uniref:GNAT family N-acetyltransferase n=1 Tax=Niveibacterium sp. SC-1 TaxID=3135646 RepID=UPI0031203FF7